MLKEEINKQGIKLISNKIGNFKNLKFNSIYIETGNITIVKCNLLGKAFSNWHNLLSNSLIIYDNDIGVKGCKYLSQGF